MAFTYIIFTIMISYITPLMIINQIGSEIGYLFIKMIYILFIYIYIYINIGLNMFSFGMA
jgi:hypothetical protein